MSDESKALAKTATAQSLDQTRQIVKAAEIDLSTVDMEGAETISMGGVTKWVDLKQFQVDPTAPQGVPVKGNGKAFAGALLSRQEIEVDEDESGEVKADGHKVRFFYLLRLAAPCPVSYKNEDKETVEEIAEVGEIVAIGERHHLRPLRELCEDGGLYVLVIQPHSRVKIGKVQTMWTFNIVKKTLRQPVKMQVIPAKAPF
jgi:hypothetical protein